MKGPTRNGRIVTFYSYKGGTGRSMALANFAWLLAASGREVVVIDWDLEAPGLHRYFRPFLTDPDLTETDGLIDAFWQFASAAFSSSANSEARNISAATHAASVADALEDSTRRLTKQFFPKGYIDFICAGRQGATYSERVNTFDWKRFYDLGGAKVVAAAKEYLRGRYEWVLIDSRTGVSDTSGVCTVQMPDTVVACFTMNRQSVDGVSAILKSIRDYKSPTIDGSSIQFFPVATRIENGESKRLEVARTYARKLMLPFLPSPARSNPRAYWDKMEISYRPAYAFEEVLAAYGDASGAKGAADTLLAQMESMAQTITDDPDLRMPEVEEEERLSELERYSFDGKTTERAPQAKGKTGLEPAGTSEFRRAVIDKEQLWRSLGFHWRALLSRRELDLLTDDDRVSFGREASSYIRQSELGQVLLKRVNRGFLLNLLMALTVSAAVYVYWHVFGVLPYKAAQPSIWYKVPFSLMVGAGTYVGLLLINALNLSVRDDAPYGVSFKNIVALLLYGPFRPVIKDLEPLRPPA